MAGIFNQLGDGDPEVIGGHHHLPQEVGRNFLADDRGYAAVDLIRILHYKNESGQQDKACIPFFI